MPIPDATRMLGQRQSCRLPTLIAALTIAGCGAAPVSLTANGAPVERSPFHDNAHNAVVRVITDRPQVALSFDDGPDRRWTPVFLRLLRRQRAAATFFLIGRRALANRSLVRAELAAGEEIGNHTLTHPRLTGMPAAEVRRQIAAGASALVRAGAPPPALFRPPFGAFDETVGGAVAASGEELIGWDLPLDNFLAHEGTRVAAMELLGKVRPGSIILAHDGALDRPRTLAALRLVLAGLQRSGYRVVTVGELLGQAAAARRASG